MKTANSNRKKTQTSASRMRAASSSVYRKVEQLLFWAMTVIDRTPNTTSFRSLGEKAMLDLEDSLDLIDLALHTKDDEQLLKFLEALSIRMRDIKTIFRIYWEKSKNIPERNIDEIGKPEKPSARILTQSQYSSFVTHMYSISVEVKLWTDKHSGAVGTDSQQKD